LAKFQEGTIPFSVHPVVRQKGAFNILKANWVFHTVGSPNNGDELKGGNEESDIPAVYY
jgi:hypothetical protein